MNEQDQMTHVLRELARGVGEEHAWDLAEIKGRARGVRRRQAAVSGLAAAAVLAVAVPSALAVGGHLGGGAPDPGPAVSPSAGPSRTSATPSEGISVPLTTHVESRSGEPGIPYLLDGAINLPDGTQVPVSADYDEVVALGNGWVAADQGAGTVSFLDASGAVTGTDRLVGSLAVSADGTVVAYATPDGALMTVTAGRGPLQVNNASSTPSRPMVTGVSGSGSCQEQYADGGGCTVFFDGEQDGRHGYYASSHGIVAKVGDLQTVNGVSPDGSVSGTTSTSDQGSCGAVLDSAGKQLWSTCDFTLGQFSPDGAYVLGHPAYRDGIGDTSLAILDARTGRVLASYRSQESTPAFINKAVWDTAGTVLATVWEKDSWSLMRMTPDGDLTSVSGAGLAGGTDMDNVPLHFSTRP